MIRIAASAVVMGLALVVAAPAPSASAATVAWSQKDKQFVKAVRSEAPAFKYVSAKDLIETAKLTCEAMDETGASPIDMAELAMDNGLTQKQAIALVAGAVVFYCPEYSY